MRRWACTLTATCVPWFDHGVFSVGHGTVVCLTSACSTQLVHGVPPSLAWRCFLRDSSQEADFFVELRCQSPQLPNWVTASAPAPHTQPVRQTQTHTTTHRSTRDLSCKGISCEPVTPGPPEHVYKQTETETETQTQSTRNTTHNTPHTPRSGHTIASFSGYFQDSLFGRGFAGSSRATMGISSIHSHASRI